MSADLSAESELLSSSNLSTLTPVTSIRIEKLENGGELVGVGLPTNADLHSPIHGVVGHTFIRLCLWFELLSSWKKRNYARPADSFVNFPVSEIKTEVDPHAAAN
jgi:hypothetical protein